VARRSIRSAGQRWHVAVSHGDAGIKAECAVIIVSLPSIQCGEETGCNEKQLPMEALCGWSSSVLRRIVRGRRAVGFIITSQICQIRRPCLFLQPIPFSKMHRV
jgi:hypothetical protein